MSTQNPLIEPSPVQKMRMKYDLTAEDLTIEVGISRPAIYKMEHGELPLSEEFTETLSYLTGIDPFEINTLQNRWIYFYQSLPNYPDLTNRPVGTKRDREYVDSFHHYVNSIASNAHLPYDQFIKSTFKSYARCARIMKVNPSGITKPAEFPASLIDALSTAGFGNIVPTLVHNYWKE